MRTMTISVTDEQAAQIAALCEERGCDKSKLIRRLVRVEYEATFTDAPVVNIASETVRDRVAAIRQQVG